MRTLILIPSLALPCLALAAAAPATPFKDKAPPEVIADGEPVSCVNTQLIRETHVRNNQVIDFEMKNGKLYRNDLGLGCPGLGFDRRFAYRLHTNQLCSVDTITVLTSPDLRPGATCGLGTFQPVKLVEAKR